jgi:hypothetical protein
MKTDEKFESFFALPEIMGGGFWVLLDKIKCGVIGLALCVGLHF